MISVLPVLISLKIPQIPETSAIPKIQKINPKVITIRTKQATINTKYPALLVFFMKASTIAIKNKIIKGIVDQTVVRPPYLICPSNFFK